jgi:hypothetical protein
MKVTDVNAAYDKQFERVEMSDKLRAAAQAAYKAMIAAELSDGSKREWEAAVDGLKAALAEPAIKDSLTASEQKPMLEMNPEKRDWFGLTDEEVWEILWETQSAELDAHGDVGNRKKSLCSLAIEAKLREKNT